MSTFNNLFSHMFMCCHFNDMLMMASCVWSLIWMLWSLNWIIECSILNFGLSKRCLTTTFNNIIFIKSPLVFIIYFSNFQKKSNNGELLDTSKKQSKNFNSIFCFLICSIYLKFTSLLQHANVVQCIWFKKQSYKL
jgi:hypothetical protein